MSRQVWGVTGAVGVALAMVMQLAGAAQAPRPAFRTGVDLVSLSVTVSTPEHRYVGGLERGDFVVLENGVRQDVTFFAPTGVPLALALLIDTSASMEQRLSIAQDAAIGFVRQIGRDDLATVVDFDSTVQIRQTFTSDFARLESAIRETAAGGSTALFNAAYVALKELNKVLADRDPEKPRRRAMIVLSDGDDTSSLVDFEQVLDLASRSDTVIYTIGLRDRNALPAHKSETGEFVLRRLAQQTGGRAFFPFEVKELSGVYQTIKDELSSQYSLAYESNGVSADGRWRQVVVRVNRPSVLVRTRQGYYAPTK